MVLDKSKLIKDAFFLHSLEKALKEINVDLKESDGTYRDVNHVLNDIAMKWKKVKR